MAGDQARPGWAVGAPEVWQALPYPRQPQEESALSISLNKVRGGVSMLVMSSMFSYEVLLLSQPQHKWKTSICFPHKLTS